VITFDRIVCINLDRRADRWQRLQEHFADMAWPFGCVDRFSAIDGHNVTPPKWWRAGAGAWGCHQSHVAVMERAIQDGISSLLILEDDALIVPRFAERLAAFLHIVPQDWDGLMFGGQHLEPPQIIAPRRGETPGLLRVRNGNRTHAYALREPYLSAACRHLCDFKGHAKRPRHHVDHRLGMLHRQFRVYAPNPWLIGQGQSASDIADAKCAERFWPLEPAREVSR